ncbi:MAG: thioredoxin domain-containing protein [Eubacteriales bacterium]|nr:thioredoxin domain-containing protein [Eubacteriales bacterium]
MSNRLKGESSPYLRQHAENPVDWYPWGDEAFEKAKRENKPVFLSIGYSTCHWCHVMAHESFENENIAEILNRNFVAVKVDREERPDIDSVYMEVCQALTGSGGWPMSLFLTPEQKPFYAGTYFPPVSRYGMPGFREVLLAVAEKWREGRAELAGMADQILSHIDRESAEPYTGIDRSLVEMAAELFARRFDRKNGGFGRAPKFPTPHNLLFLTLYAFQKQDEEAFFQVEKTLEAMRKGGIFDQIGYGFSRYSTDGRFLVPHFEKMLYDNALLIMAYAAAYAVGRKRPLSGEDRMSQERPLSGEDRMSRKRPLSGGDRTSQERPFSGEDKASRARLFLDTAEKTADYILREMTDEGGAFYSAQDADSEGEEGKFYVWRYEEICRVLGKKKGKAFCNAFGITKEGNFEGKNIPNLLHRSNIAPEEWEEEKQILYAYRKSRAKLHLDDKILTSWNALMICAMAVLYRVTGKERYLSAAEKAYHFLEEHLADENILYVSQARAVKGFLDEYAYFTAALLGLYESTGNNAYLDRAVSIAREAMRQFGDEKGGCFLYGPENSRLITRPKETYDGALPSGNAVLAYCLVRISQLAETDAQVFREAAKRQLAFLSAEAQHNPTQHSMFLIALLFYEEPPQKITVAPAEGECAGKLRSRLPLYADIKILERETEEYRLLNGRTTYYVCKDHTCLPPTNKIV